MFSGANPKPPLKGSPTPREGATPPGPTPRTTSGAARLRQSGDRCAADCWDSLSLLHTPTLKIPYETLNVSTEEKYAHICHRNVKGSFNLTCN